MQRFLSLVLLLLFIFIECDVLKGQMDGSLDLSFNLGLNINGRFGIVEQPNGKSLIVGNFTTINGILCNRIARLNANGSLDTSFHSVISDSTFNFLSVQTDGKILFMTSDNFGFYKYIQRLNADGSLDTGFNLGTTTGGYISSIVYQTDGKIIIAGSFNSFNGTAMNRIAHLHTDGSLDTNFVIGTGVSGSVYSTILQPDGKIIIAGEFFTYNNSTWGSIVRINPDGSLDTTFNAEGAAIGPGYTRISSALLQSDGKIIISGYFMSNNSTVRANIARLNSDGTLDTGFTPGNGADTEILTSALQTDGKIIIGGYFTFYNGLSRNRIARLNSNGSLDTTFNPGSGANNTIARTVILKDGKIMINGDFTTYNGIIINYIARIHAKSYHINGSLFNDLNSNCTKNSNENYISEIQNLIIQPGNLVAQANNGYWSIDSLPPGTYTATVDTSGQWRATCSPSVSFTVVHPDSFIQVTPIGMKNINPCTEPEISIYAPFLRRCLTNQNIFVEATNNYQATGVMYNAYADVTLDPFLTVDSASRPYTVLGNNVYRFQLDSLYPGQSKTWTISTTVSCSTSLGQTLCMDAEIFPVASCVLDSTPNPVVGVSPCLGLGTNRV